MQDQIERISVDLIDDPHVPMRSEFDEEKLQELAKSIIAHGLIQPITLRKSGGRFEVVAGHRRFLATKRAGLPVIPAIVRELDDKETDAQRMHENLFRADINPVDEARYIRSMIEKHDYDPKALAELTGKSEAYLHARVDLLDYPEYLVDALQQEKMSLAAAAWLAKITDDRVRAEYTRFALNGGITARRAEAWYRSWELGSLPREASTYVPPEEGDAPVALALKMPCVICRHDDDIENMGMHYGHRECVGVMAEAAKKQA